MRFDETLLRQVLAAMPRVTVFIVDAAGVHRLCGGDANVLADMGFGPDQVEGRPLGYTLDKPDDPWRGNVIAAQAVLAQGVEVNGINIATATRHYQCSVHPIRDEELIAGCVITVHDVSHRKRNDDQVTKWMRTDPLTGVGNRNRLQLALTRAVRSEAEFALVYLDLDGFKALNDASGHAAGDACLQAVAKTLELSTRAGDLVARVGGDEFAVLLTSAGGVDAIDVVTRRFRAAVKALPFGVELSLGVATFPEDGRDVTTLLRAADHRMYADKRGRKPRE